MTDEIEARNLYGIKTLKVVTPPAIVTDADEDWTPSDKIENAAMRLIDFIGFPMFAIGCIVGMAFCAAVLFG